ncbi:MAG: DUF1254 domain-containing protein [Caldilineaceae bacterium]
MVAWLELGNEPMVIETPPNVLGFIDDHWFKYVTDFGKPDGPWAGRQIPDSAAGLRGRCPG